MLTSRDLYTEMDAIEKVDPANQTEVNKALLKANVLQLRLLHNTRTNTALIMEKVGADKIKPQAAQSGDASQSRS